jgi:hypothetical protein
MGLVEEEHQPGLSGFPHLRRTSNSSESIHSRKVAYSVGFCTSFTQFQEIDHAPARRARCAFQSRMSSSGSPKRARPP